MVEASPGAPYLSRTEEPRIGHSTPDMAEDEERGGMVLLCPFLQPVEVLLKVCAALWGIGHSSQLCVICELAEEASSRASKSLMDGLNNTGPSIETWMMLLMTITTVEKL